MYILQILVVKNDLKIWNEPLGPQDKRHVCKFLKEKEIEVNMDSEICEACIHGKMHRLSFGRRTEHPNKPGELINADVCCPMPAKTLSGMRFSCFQGQFLKVQICKLYGRNV